MVADAKDYAMMCRHAGVAVALRGRREMPSRQLGERQSLRGSRFGRIRLFSG